MNESPEEKYHRLQSDIQRGILRGFPNPERRGCPDDTVVRNLAANPDRITSEDDRDKRSAWYHITHCSPCYASFLELRNAGRSH